MENLLWRIIFAFFLAYLSQVMTESVTSDMLLNYEDIVRLTGEKSIILIDVRQPHELQETGVLPTSINIPLNNLKTALESLSSEEFQKKYGIPLPDKNAPLVFTCRSGNRSMKALLTALELGFKDAKHYAGGYLDWEKNKGLSEKKEKH
ncbi:hypothetical protein R5R35_000432 [Gryllus longicercus]|uniref:Rhodanese domain-containing protein n=2 Tax=Gryllus longicercus TaxID=2509291 RepID=A0AAN9YZU2_9ORTH